MAATKLFRQSRNELDIESVELEKAAAALVVKVKDKASEARKAAVNAGIMAGNLLAVRELIEAVAASKQEASKVRLEKHHLTAELKSERAASGAKSSVIDDQESELVSQRAQTSEYALALAALEEKSEALRLAVEVCSEVRKRRPLASVSEASSQGDAAATQQ